MSDQEVEEQKEPEEFDIDLTEDDTNEAIDVKQASFSKFNSLKHPNDLKKVTEICNRGLQFKQAKDV